jgi:hypothetical protein
MTRIGIGIGIEVLGYSGSPQQQPHSRAADLLPPVQTILAGRAVS